MALKIKIFDPAPEGTPVSEFIHLHVHSDYSIRRHLSWHRGGAGSIVAYAMTITDIDPIRYKLIFERFLNPERVSMPDFDVDMDFDYRQEIIQHTHDLYGNDNVGHIVTFATLKAKQVIKDVARVLDIPLPEVKVLTDCIPGDDPKFTLDMALTPPTKETPDNGKLIPYTDVQKYPQYERLFRIARKLENVIRGVSLHGIRNGNWSYRASKLGPGL